jgi:hypothetical protein
VEGALPVPARVLAAAATDTLGGLPGGDEESNLRKAVVLVGAALENDAVADDDDTQEIVALFPSRRAQSLVLVESIFSKDKQAVVSDDASSSGC